MTDTAGSFLSSFFSKENRKTALILFYSVISLSTWYLMPRSGYFANTDGTVLVTPEMFTVAGFLNGLTPLISAFILLGVIPALIVKFVFKEKLADYGVQFGIKLRTFRTMLIFVPIMFLSGWLSGCYAPSFYSWYPYNPLAGCGPGPFGIYTICYLVLFYFAWEFMFRGFMQKGLSAQLGIPAAVLIQTLASVTTHFGHPGPEIYASIGAGILWGFLAIRTKSLLSGIIQHATIGIVLDASLIYYAVS